MRLTRWIPLAQRIITLGTDGFGRSESRQALRDFFEVDYRYVTLAALATLVRDEKIGPDVISACDGRSGN